MNDKPAKEIKGRLLHFDRDASFFVKRGDVKRAQNDPIGALSLYIEALERDPHNFSVRLAAGEMLTDIERYNESNKLLIPFMHEDSDYAKEAYSIVGFNLLSMGEYDGARDCFDRFLSMTSEVSDRTDAMLEAIEFMDSLPDPAALTDAADAEKDQKKEAAFMWFELGDYERSVKEHNELIQKYPNDTDVLYRLALSCVCAFDYKDANAYLDRLLEIQPDHWSAMGMKLIVAQKLNNEPEALRICRKLEQCNSDSPEELLRVNGALLEAGKYAAANVIANRLLRIMPYDCVANHRLAIGLVRLGFYKKAAEIYDLLVRIDKYDRIARYYRAGCIEAASDPDCDFLKQDMMIHYQLPIQVIMEDVKGILNSGEVPGMAGLRKAWQNDPETKMLVRWAINLKEYSISHAMIILLDYMKDRDSELMLREVCADVYTRESILNEALGALKNMDAAEPFFVISAGRLLEGRVSLVDLGDKRIPKAYRDIYPRICEVSGEAVGMEALSVASGLTERFIMISVKNGKPITKEQSAALSAAVELIVRERCGLAPDDDLCERYGITGKRLQNALERLLTTLESESAETDDNGGGEME